VEGIKVCQMAGQSIGKAWQREKGESLETRCVESLLVIYVLYVSLLSLMLSLCHWTGSIPVSEDSFT